MNRTTKKEYSAPIEGEIVEDNMLTVSVEDILQRLPANIRRSVSKTAIKKALKASNLEERGRREDFLVTFQEFARTYLSQEGENLNIDTYIKAMVFCQHYLANNRNAEAAFRSAFPPIIVELEQKYKRKDAIQNRISAATSALVNSKAVKALLRVLEAPSYILHAGVRDETVQVLQHTMHKQVEFMDRLFEDAKESTNPLTYASKLSQAVSAVTKIADSISKYVPEPIEAPIQISQNTTFNKNEQHNAINIDASIGKQLQKQVKTMLALTGDSSKGRNIDNPYSALNKDLTALNSIREKVAVSVRKEQESEEGHEEGGEQ